MAVIVIQPLTCCAEVFPACDNFNCSFKAFGIFGTTCEKPPGNELINPFIIPSEVVCVSSGVYWRVRLIILLPPSRCAEAPVLEAKAI